VFGRDMIYLLSNIQQIGNVLNEVAARESVKRKKHVFRVRDKVLLSRETEKKHESSYQGSFDIVQVKNNSRHAIKLNISKIKVRDNMRAR
jgi:hypothetical protein